MRRLWFVALLALAAAACATRNADLPNSLRERVSEFQSLPPAQPPRAIYRTSYRGLPAFFVTSACCDIPSELYDESGNLICYPGGSIMGRDERCPGYGLPTSAALVWRDGREPMEREKN